jgi:hypothetical protein
MDVLQERLFKAVTMSIAEEAWVETIAPVEEHKIFHLFSMLVSNSLVILPLFLYVTNVGTVTPLNAHVGPNVPSGNIRSTPLLCSSFKFAIYSPNSHNLDNPQIMG